MNHAAADSRSLFRPTSGHAARFAIEGDLRRPAFSKEVIRKNLDPAHCIKLFGRVCTNVWFGITHETCGAAVRACTNLHLFGVRRFILRNGSSASCQWRYHDGNLIIKKTASVRIICERAVLRFATRSNDVLDIDDSGDNNAGNDGNKGDNDGEGNGNSDVHTDDNHVRTVEAGFEFDQATDSYTLFTPSLSS
jgi:hypothetical protein